MIEIVSESLNSLLNAINIFLQTKDLTLGAILAALTPLIVIWVKLSREKEKRARAVLVERRQLQIAFNVNEIMEALKVESKWSLQQIGLPNMDQASLKPWWITFAKVIIKKTLSSLRRKNNMREYLKKLGRTKFQAFIIITVTNILMLVGYIMNVANIQDIANGWMPAINLVAQLISTIVYQAVEGQIDKAREIAKPYVNDEIAVDYSKSDSTAE